MSLGSRLGDLVGRTRRARIITVLTIGAVAAAVIAFVAIDSGDDSGSDLSPYQGEVDRICVEGKKDLGEAGGRIFRGDEPQKFARYSIASRRIARRTQSQFAGLDPPEEFRARAAELDAAFDGLYPPLDQLERAGRTGDPSELQAASQAVQAASAHTDQAIEAIGAEACPRLTVGLFRLRPAS